MRKATEDNDVDPNLIGSFARGLAVIESFDQNEARQTTADVARRTGLERATARRCLLTLVKLGYAEYDGKFFSLTPRLLRLGFAYLSSIPLPRLVQPFLEQLSERTQETCSVAVLDGTEVVYIARAQRPGLSYGLRVGSRLPAYASSMGRILLAALPPKEARRLLQESERKKLTPRTRTDIPELLTEFERIRAQGYAVMDEELAIGLRSVAVPILNAKETVIAGMNVGTNTGRSTAKSMISQILPEMLRIQGELRQLLR